MQIDLKKVKKNKRAFRKTPFCLNILSCLRQSDRFGLFHAPARTAADRFGSNRRLGSGQVFDAVICRRCIQVAVGFAVGSLHRNVPATDQKALIEIFKADIGLFAHAGDFFALGLVILRGGAAVIVVLLLKLRLMTVIFVVRLVQHALVMLRMLQVAFRQDTVARALRVARQRQVFFGDLHGIAANAHIGAVAVECLHARVDAALPAIVVMMVLATTVTAAIAVPVIIVTAAKTSSVLIMSHITHFALIYRPVSPCSRHIGTQEPPSSVLFCKRDAIFRRTHKSMLLKPESLEKLFFRKILI